jgi:hypothetical protein
MGTRHTVRRGDSLWRLANIYMGSGTLYPLIVDYHNEEAARQGPRGKLLPIEDPNLIYVGQTVMVPSREKNPPPCTGNINEANQSAKGMGFKTGYNILDDKKTTHYRTITTDYTVEATMTGEIAIENMTHNNYRYNFELALSRDKMELKRKLDEFSNKAFSDLTDGVKMKYESGQVTLQTPLATYANAGPYIVRVAADAPNHFSGSFRTEPLSATVEKDRLRYKYTAEVEFKIEVTWHPRPRTGPEPVQVTDPQHKTAATPIESSFQSAKNVGAFVVSVVLAIATVYAGCVGMRSGAFRPGGMPLQPNGATTATPSMFLIYEITPGPNA